MLITKIQLSAMERVRSPEDERVDFYLYVDEFQNFATDSFASVLSEARKYRLNLILAHQYVGQLITDVSTTKSTKIRDAIFGNVGTMVIFRVGATDAEFLEPEFEPEFTIMDIVNLPNYHIYLKLMVSGVTSRPFSAKTLPPFNMKTNAMEAQEIIEYSRKRYARPRETVEDEIRKWSGMTASSLGGSETAPSGGSLSSTPPDLSGPGFQVTCSACNRETKVPFEPAPGRPVYCKDCLQKIKDGTMQPVRRGSRPAASESRVDTSDLAMMGIEFKMEESKPAKEEPVTRAARPARHASIAEKTKQPKKEEKQEEETPPPPRRASIIEDEPADADDSPSKEQHRDGLSLADLRPPKNVKPKKEHQHAEVNVDELRKAIAESLNKNEDPAD
jgi:CxxC-x17-CxxC domain-containing protein